MRPHRIFIAYGHDHEARDDLKALVGGMGLDPRVFLDTPTSSQTNIERFEAMASDVSFALILMTPDDRVSAIKSLDSDADRSRARQNVIFEMGFFFGRLGRSKTLLLLRGDVEIPSNLAGVGYERFDRRPSEISEKIKSTLLSAGLIRR